MKLTMEVDDVFYHLAPVLQAPGSRRIIEIGAHDGKHSDLIRTLCRERPHYLAIEPDQRNIKTMLQSGLQVVNFAVSDRDGEADWYESRGTTPGTQNRCHTDSSSLKRPTKHLEVHPWCEFEKASYQVMTMTLDSVMSHIGWYYWCEDPPQEIDLIWADVQGAQLEVIRGGEKCLSMTRYLFIEVHPEPYYAGEPSFRNLHSDLEKVSGCDWEIVEHYPADVLLKRVGSS